MHTSLTLSGRATPRIPVLYLGSGERTSHGSAAVRRLQRGLTHAGYAPGPVDGRYGPLTAAAVERFQANHALTVDGIVGPVTRHALRATPVLAIGAGETSLQGSPAVARLQLELRRAGFAPGPIDGRFGPRTEHALLDFQRARHLEVDGITGPITERALRAGPRLTSQPIDPQGGAAPAHPTPTGHTSPLKHSPKPATVQPAQASPRVPTALILMVLGLIGLVAVVTGYFQRPARSRTPGPTPEPLPEPAAGVTFLLYADNNGSYYWTIVSDRGEALARSAAFASYEQANHAADIVYRGVAGASFEDRSGQPPPVDLRAAVDAGERRLDHGGGVSRGQVTDPARPTGWVWPAGSSSTLGGPDRGGLRERDGVFPVADLGG